MAAAGFRTTMNSYVNPSLAVRNNRTPESCSETCVASFAFADVDSELPAACHCYAPRAPQPVGTAMRLRVKFEQPLLSSATRNAGKQLLLRRKLSLF